MINKYLLLISALLLFVSVLFDVNYLNYSFPIEHVNYSEISLKDFKGLKRLNENLYGNSEFAFIETEIKITDDRYPFVKTFFHPSRSYTYKDNMIGDKKLLSHELYHFHITEYIARRMRKELSEKGYTDVEELLKIYKIEENKLQQEYDKDTHHSYYAGRQIAWQKKIDSLLITVNNYR